MARITFANAGQLRIVIRTTHEINIDGIKSKSFELLTLLKLINHQALQVLFA